MTFCIDDTVQKKFAESLERPLPWHRQIASQDDVTAAVHVVYHTVKVLDAKMPDRDKLWPDVSLVLDDAGEKIWQYFNGEPNTSLTPQNYDSFLYRLCGRFVVDYNQLATGAGIPPIEFGVAQKLINTVFVYLACFDDYMTYADLFAWCHMPLDTYIFSYLANHNTVERMRTHYKNGMIAPNASYVCPLCKKKKTWDTMSVCCYKSIVSQYRVKYRKRYPEYTPLNLYFYIKDFAKETYAPEPNINEIPPCSPPLPGTKRAFHT